MHTVKEFRLRTMSQLIISRLFKPSVSRNFLRRTNVRLFSYTSGSASDDDENRPFLSRPAYSFLLIDHLLKNPDSPDGQVRERYEEEDCPEVKEITIDDEKLREEVCNAMTVVFSRDGLRFGTYGYNKFTISYKPSDRELKDMTVYLPDLPTGSKIQNIAMSS